MHPIFAKTFGGMAAAEYFRHFLFGLVFSGFIYAMVTYGDRAIGVPAMLLIVSNTFLYPYARFVYESVVNFILGQNVFVAEAILVLGVKIATIAMCWILAIFIAPVGLCYLYFLHSKPPR